MISILPKNYTNLILIPDGRFIAKITDQKDLNKTIKERFKSQEPVLFGKCLLKNRTYSEYFNNEKINTKSLDCKEVADNFDKGIKNYSNNAISMFSINSNLSEKIKRASSMSENQITIQNSKQNLSISIEKKSGMTLKSDAIWIFTTNLNATSKKDFKLHLPSLFSKYLWKDGFAVRISETGLVEFSSQTTELQLFVLGKLNFI